MTPDEILTLSDLNTAESLRQFARFHSASRIVEQDGVLLIAAADDFPVGFSNAVFPLTDSPDPGKLLAAGDAFFGPMGRGYTIWIRGHRDAKLEAECESRGFVALGDSPGMVLDAPAAESKPIASP